MNPRLPIRSCPHSVAFREIARRIRVDQDVQRAVKTLVAWDGSPLDTQDPTASMIPWVRLTPTGQGGSWTTNVSHEARLVIEVELITPGTHWDDLANLWHAVALSLFASPFSRETTYIRQVTITQPVVTPALYEDLSALAGKGQISLLIHLSTTYGSN